MPDLMLEPKSHAMTKDMLNFILIMVECCIYHKPREFGESSSESEGGFDESKLPTGPPQPTDPEERSVPSRS